MYAELGNFKDSADLKAQAEAKKQELEEEKQELLKAQAYADAEALLTNNDFDGAIEGFKKISGYKDADERALEACYKKADSLQAAGNNKAAAIVSGWTDIVAISAGSDSTVGLKADGTVVAVGDNEYGQCDVSDWTDIVAISVDDHTVGLKKDGTVVAVGENKYGQCDVSGWTDIKLPQINGTD